MMRSSQPIHRIAAWIYLFASISAVSGFQTVKGFRQSRTLIGQCSNAGRKGRYFTSTATSDFPFERVTKRSVANTADIVTGSDHLSIERLKDDSTKQIPPFPVVVWRFTRPHTIIGSAMAVPALHLLAAPSLSAAFSTATLSSITSAVVPALLMNLYITGLNQITDVEIDKVNKPYLPIPAGMLSIPVASVLVTISLIASLWIGSFAGTQGLNVALWGSAILGTLYSLPPFRFKRFPLLAAFCIVAVRGAIINAGFFQHARAAVFGSSASVLSCLTKDPKCMLSSLFFAVFGIVIALMKDVPDVHGDKLSSIRTFSVRLGQKPVYRAMQYLLTGSFLACGLAFVRLALFSSVSLGVAISRGITGTASILFGLSVQREAKKYDPEDSNQVYTFYMHLWKLFYLSYVVLPFAM